MGFEKWTAKSRVFRRPTITLARDARTFYLNRTALAGLGGADWVSLWFDPGRRMVSIRPAKPTEEGSYHICDIILSHKLTTRDDVSALNRLSQDYMGSELQNLIKKLKRVGEAILVDDERETVHHLGIRPRQSHHGGSSVAPAEEDRLELWSD